MTTRETSFIFDKHWARLPSSQRLNLGRRISRRFTGLDVSKLTSRTLTSHRIPFYPKYELIRLTGFDTRRLYAAYFLCEIDGPELLALDGQSRPIHELNARQELVLNESTLRQYLMFFCFFVHGDEGPFLLLDSMDSAGFRRIRERLGEEKKSSITVKTATSEHWAVRAGLVYGDHAFVADFQVARSGMMTMTDHTLLTRVLKRDYRAKRFPRFAARSRRRALPRAQRKPAASDERPQPPTKPMANEDMIQFLDIDELTAHLKASAEDNARQAVLQRYHMALKANAGSVAVGKTPEPWKGLTALAEKYPNFAELIDFVNNELTFARLLKGGRIHLPPLIVDGEPGVGKTRFLHELAKTLGLPLETLDMASATAGFELSGSSSVWRGGRPGLALESIMRSKTANPIILLDELDKLPQQDSSPIDGPLHALLEPVTARHYRDEYLKIRADFSHINWIATCNDYGKLTTPIQSRFTRFQVRPPSHRQLPIIIQSIYVDLLAERQIGHAFASRLGAPIVERLARRSSQPRQLRSALWKAIVAAAVRTHRERPDEPLQDVRVDTIDLLTSQLSHNADAPPDDRLM